MVLRHEEGNELGMHSFADQLELAFKRVKSVIQSYPSKRIPIIQEEIRFWAQLYFPYNI